MSLTAESLHSSDAQLKNVNYELYFNLASNESLEKAKASLLEKGYKVDVAETKAAALELLKNAIPKGASVNNGGSTTLQEIGFIDYLKEETGWDNIHAKILAEPDFGKQSELRRRANVVDYFVTSATAVTENGSLTVCDASGTKVGPIAHAADHVIFVLGAQKIVATYEDAVKRTQEFCLPLESARARIAYAAMGVQGSAINNFLAIHGPNPWAKPGRFHFIIIKEKIGY